MDHLNFLSCIWIVVLWLFAFVDKNIWSRGNKIYTTSYRSHCQTLARHLFNCTMSDMEVDHPAPKGKEKKEAKPRFEVKKVRLRSGWISSTDMRYPPVECCCSLGLGCAFLTLKKIWCGTHRISVDIVVDNCAICRNHIMDLCTFSEPNWLAHWQPRSHRYWLSGQPSISD